MKKVKKKFIIVLMIILTSISFLNVYKADSGFDSSYDSGGSSSSSSSDSGSSGSSGHSRTLTPEEYQAEMRKLEIIGSVIVFSSITLFFVGVPLFVILETKKYYKDKKIKLCNVFNKFDKAQELDSSKINRYYNYDDLKEKTIQLFGNYYINLINANYNLMYDLCSKKYYKEVINILDKKYVKGARKIKYIPRCETYKLISLEENDNDLVIGIYMKLENYKNKKEYIHVFMKIVTSKKDLNTMKIDTVEIGDIYEETY